MSTRLHRIAIFVTAALLVFGIVGRAPAQAVPAQNTQLAQAMSQSVPQPEAPQSQAVSQTGLLPLFAVDMEVDPAWVDGDSVPSSSPQFSHSGVNDVLDQAWTTLKPAGFNAIRFPIHLDDTKSPVRLANLCLWASSNGFRLIPVLEGTEPMRNSPSSMASAVSTLITTVISRLQGASGSALAYAQISFYQLERPMNHAGLYPGISAGSAQQFLSASAAALRQAETQALQGTGVQATPISISASLDYELIQQGAIAGIPLDAGAEQRAQDSLSQFLKGFNSPNVDAINVEWFPRSISSGDVDHFVALLRVLKQAFPDKQITLTTGFSTAFNPPDLALQFNAAAISNLASFRASDGLDSKFVGLVFQQAFKGINADSPTPVGTADPGQWKWNDRAQQLSAMWSKGTPSADMAWWIGKVRDNMGLLALQPNGTSAASLTPLPSLQVLQEISSTLAQATQQVQTPPDATAGTASVSPAVPANVNGTGFVAPPTSGYVPGAQPSGQTAGSPFQQLMFNLLQQFTQQIATKLITRLNGPGQQAQYINSASPGASLPAEAALSSPSGAPNSSMAPSGRSSFANTVWIGPSDINVSTTSPAMGQSVVVTAQIHNQSPDQDVSGLTIQVLNPANPAAASQSAQTGVNVTRSSVTPVQLSWTPDAVSVGQVQLLLEALDSSGQIVTSVAIPTITVQSGASLSNTASVNNVAGTPTDTATGSLANTRPANASSPTDSGGSMTSIAATTPTSTTTPTAATPGATSGTTATPQLTVNSFGFADPNASAAGQIPQLLAQVANPSQLPTQSGQAQLFLDGTPQQMQTIGAVLPSGTLFLQFAGMQASAGQHNLQLVLNTTDGSSASATLMAKVTAVPATTSPSNSTPVGSPSSNLPAGPARPINVRAVAPMTYRIGNVMQAIPSSPGGVSLPKNPSATASVPSGTNSQPRQFVSSPSNGTGTVVSNPSGGVVRTITPRSVPTGGITAKTPAAVASSAPSANTGMQSAAPSAPSATRTLTATPQGGGVRTITPNSAAATPLIATQRNAALPAPAVRTITPGPSSAGTLAFNAPAAQSSLRTGTSASPAATRPNIGAGVRTITPASTPAAKGATVVPPATVAMAAVPQAASTTRTILGTSAPTTGGALNNFSPPSTPRTPAGSTSTPATTPALLDLAISSQDIHLIPTPPRAGQTAMFTAAIKNVGTVPAQGATVIFLLLANGQRLGSSQPMIFNVAPRGVFQARWSTAVPAVSGMQVVVSVTAKGDGNPGNNQAVLPFAVAVVPAKAALKPH